MGIEEDKGKLRREVLAEALLAEGYSVLRHSPITSRILDAAAEISASPPDHVNYQHSVLCQVGLPRSLVAGHRFASFNGDASLLMEAGSLWNGQQWIEQALPYGPKPRLALIHICTKAVLDQTPRIEIGASMREFLIKLGLDTGGHEYERFRAQMTALAACRMTIGFGQSTIDAKPIKEFSAWLDNSGGQRTIWPGEIELTAEFFKSLVEHAVPIDPRAVLALRHSALALDIYMWLAHRLHREKRANGTLLSWANLIAQFGQAYSDSRNFKKQMRQTLPSVRAAYPDATLEFEPGGLRLFRSKPPVPKTKVVIQTIR